MGGGGGLSAKCTLRPSGVLVKHWSAGGKRIQSESGSTAASWGSGHSVFLESGATMHYKRGGRRDGVLGCFLGRVLNAPHPNPRPPSYGCQGFRMLDVRSWWLLDCCWPFLGPGSKESYQTWGCSLSVACHPLGPHVCTLFKSPSRHFQSLITSDSTSIIHQPNYPFQSTFPTAAAAPPAVIPITGAARCTFLISLVPSKTGTTSHPVCRPRFGPSPAHTAAQRWRSPNSHRRPTAFGSFRAFHSGLSPNTGHA